jgi:cobalt/nickel transport system ATP-binding protein
MNSPRGCDVEVHDLAFGYHKDQPVLDGISLTIRAGERLGILGQSGAGKSTFLLHLNGILHPQRGTIRIGSESVKSENISKIRSQVGLVFQNPDDQLFNATVEEDVAFGPRNLGWPESKVREHVQKALHEMGLAGYESRPVHELSYGEKRRAALATVLSMEPRLIAFDEPFANLDPSMVEQLVEVIRNLDATVILVSQAILPALACCDRIALFHHGRVEAVGSTEEIATNRALLKACGIDFHFYGQIWRRFFGDEELAC